MNRTLGPVAVALLVIILGLFLALVSGPEETTRRWGLPARETGIGAVVLGVVVLATVAVRGRARRR
jgi:hypothetical protein